VRAALSRSDWKRLNRLLAQALEVDATARAGWIASLPASQRDLLPVLEQLLAQSGASLAIETAEFMPRLRSDALPPQPGAAERDERPGAQIGPYRLLRELGVGGMGSVWLAERTDGTFERQVALKLPRAEWTDRGLNERMARERNVLASLNHPNIAQMYDAGWASDGRPYLALEHVEGQPIDAWCRDRKLDVPARLELFADVVRAVAFAHSKLVIHRDIKPSNVLVTTEGRVKLLDFGIAKLLSADAALAEETALTRMAGRALTLNYAAPEHVLGQPISTAADTYSLGVMLYELLSGTRPYRPERDSRGALEEAIVTIDPPAPSSVAADKAAARALRGDLDTIILKALRKKPEERYETAAAFADDLERWLAGKPVRAQRDSTWYRTRRFLARHRVTLAVAGAATSALLIGGGVALWQFHTAGEESARADMVRGFVLSIIAQADPATGGETRAADLTLLTTAESRIASELSGRPALALQMRVAIAKAYRNRGEFARMRATLRQAIDAAQAVLPADDPQLVRAWIEIADLQVFEADEVSAGLDRAIASARRMGDRGVELLIDGLLARMHRRLVFEFKHDEARADVREAQALALKHFGEGHPTTLIASSKLACCGDVPPAERLELARQTYETARVHPALGTSHPRVLEMQCTYGHLLIGAGRTREGLELLHAAVATARRAHGDGFVTEDALFMLAEGMRNMGDVGGALKVAKEGYALAAAREPTGGLTRSQRARDVFNMGISARRFAEVAPMLDEYTSMIPQLHGSNERFRHFTEPEHLWLLNGTGDTIRAARLAPQAIENAARYGWLDNAFRARWAWVFALRENGELEEAERVLNSRADAPHGPAGGEFRHPGLMHAAVRLDLGDAEQAVSFVDAQLKRISVARVQTDPFIADNHIVRGAALLQLGRAAEARESFRIADEFWQEFDPQTPWAAEARYWHGRSLIETGDAVRGRQWMRDAIPGLAKSHLPSHRALASSSPSLR
jgi:serine/threonine-protein kinase